MNELPQIGIRVDGSMGPRECVSLAQAAEASGLAGVWFAENAFARGILPAAAACAIATKNIRINSGVFNPYNRHPTLMAMEIGALDELSNGRASLGIGAGILAASEKMGLNAAKPAPALRDALIIIRELLENKEVDYQGSVFSAKKVKLNYRVRNDIPIYLAGRGNITVKLAGEFADGLLISNMCSIKFASHLAELMRFSARAAGRSPSKKVVQYMPCATHADSREAFFAAKVAIGEMLPRFWQLGQKLDSAKEALLAGTAISESDFSDCTLRLLAGEKAADVLDDRFVAAFSLSGTPDQCLVRAQQYKAMGIDELALTFSGPRAAEEIAAIGAALRSATT
ncbi:MAG TPA: LLM class flavin-dependent oxidoreductase [Pseudolabrys sp.]|nr:LLM class flavin-dependent oxidoreductase [Pseudolabrys sp.]